MCTQKETAQTTEHITAEVKSLLIVKSTSTPFTFIHVQRSNSTNFEIDCMNSEQAHTSERNILAHARRALPAAPILRAVITIVTVESRGRSRTSNRVILLICADANAPRLHPPWRCIGMAGLEPAAFWFQTRYSAIEIHPG